jgi:Mannosyltransferase (PIG-V)
VPPSRGSGKQATAGRPVLAALGIAVATRAALAGIVWFAVRVVPRHAPYPEQIPDTFFPDHPALDGWARWDAAHYVAIARLGYGPDNPSHHGGVGFFPLYPLLMRALVELVGAAPTDANLAFAGILIANVCFLGAVALLAWLGAERFGPRVGVEAALLLCVMPFGFFMNAAYSESLFLLLVLASLAFAGRGHWWLAGTAAGLASATRLVGLALAPALLLAAYRRGAKLADLLVTGALAVSGTAAYFLYCAWRFDDPFVYFDAQAEWGGWDEHVRFYADLFLLHPRQALAGRPEDLIVALDVAVGLAFLLFLPRLWRLGIPEIALLSTLLVVVQGAFTWLSLGRYVLPAVGVYLAAALWLGAPRWSGWVRDAIVVVSALLMGFLAILYATGFWIV